MSECSIWRVKKHAYFETSLLHDKQNKLEGEGDEEEEVCGVAESAGMYTQVDRQDGKRDAPNLRMHKKTSRGKCA